MYLLNIFDESKDNDYINNILTCSDTNPWPFKTVNRQTPIYL